MPEWSDRPLWGEDDDDDAPWHRAAEWEPPEDEPDDTDTDTDSYLLLIMEMTLDGWAPSADMFEDVERDVGWPISLAGGEFWLFYRDMLNEEVDE